VTFADDCNGDERVDDRLVDRILRPGSPLSAILDRHRIEIEELRRLREARRQLDLAVNAARHPAPRPLRRLDGDCA
jgi:hypothetical protein